MDLGSTEYYYFLFKMFAISGRIGPNMTRASIVINSYVYGPMSIPVTSRINDATHTAAIRSVMFCPCLILVDIRTEHP
jgi:hypothetical protein